MKNSYMTRTLASLEKDNMRRDHALPGFPYISFKGAECLKIAHALKVLSRDNAIAVFHGGSDRSDKYRIDTTNRILRDVASKDYLKHENLGSNFGYVYTLGRLGFEFLGKSMYDTDFSTREILNYRNVNRMFNVLVEKYRNDCVVEWATDTGTGDAESAVWTDNTREKAIERHIWIGLRERLWEDQIGEALEKQKEFLGSEIDVYVVSPKDKDFSLKIVENGKACINDTGIVEWITQE